jgi:lipid A oxidase
MTSTVRSTLRISSIAAAAIAALLGVSIDPRASQAETQISVYGGANTNFSSRGTLVSGATVDSREFDWEGKSFEMPPYWGAMITHWWKRGAGWGLGVDFTHAKAYADINFATDPVYSHLEFTDGNNLLMLNLMYRFNPVLNGKLTPFVGIGAGVAIPHVEVDLKNGAPNTREYQLAGGAGQVLAGLEYELDKSWSVFAAGKLSYSHLATDLEGGGHFKTHLWSPQIAIGLSYRFGN